MQYLVTHENYAPFYTNWFSLDNNYFEGLVVFDLINHTYCADGKNWLETKQDSL